MHVASQPLVSSAHEWFLTSACMCVPHHKGLYDIQVTYKQTRHPHLSFVSPSHSLHPTITFLPQKRLLDCFHSGRVFVVYLPTGHAEHPYTNVTSNHSIAPHLVRHGTDGHATLMDPTKQRSHPGPPGNSTNSTMDGPHQGLRRNLRAYKTYQSSYKGPSWGFNWDPITEDAVDRNYDVYTDAYIRVLCTRCFAYFTSGMWILPIIGATWHVTV
jgi:hypothetical protein